MIIPRPQIEPLPQPSVWSPPRFRMVSDQVIVLDDGLEIIVPSGFETDLASIPRPLWAVPGFSPTGPLIYGSPSHDIGYQQGYLLTPYMPKKHTYPETSMRLREQFQKEFGDLIPVFVGRNQKFFDQLLSGITIEATGRRFVAVSAGIALGIWGDRAWSTYREKGPSAYNTNSLGLPGITLSGVRF